MLISNQNLLDRIWRRGHIHPGEGTGHEPLVSPGSCTQGSPYLLGEIEAETIEGVRLNYHHYVNNVNFYNLSTIASFCGVILLKRFIKFCQLAVNESIVNILLQVQKFHIDEVYDSKVKAKNWENLIEEFHALTENRVTISKPQIIR